MDLFNCMEDEDFQLCQELKNSPFKHYLRYLNGINELGDREKAIYQGIGNEFLEMLESTQMSKPYKMTVLLAFYNGGEIKMAIDEDDIYRSYMKFYNTANNWKNLEKDKATSDFRTWDKKRCVSEALKNPVLFMAVRYRNEFTFHVPGFFYFILLRELNSWEEETFSVMDDTVSCSYVMRVIIYKREVS